MYRTNKFVEQVLNIFFLHVCPYHTYFILEFMNAPVFWLFPILEGAQCGNQGQWWENVGELSVTEPQNKRFRYHHHCNLFSLALKLLIYLQLPLYHTRFSTGANEFQHRFRIKHPPVHTWSTCSTQAYHADHYLPLNTLLYTHLTASAVMLL